MKRAVVLCILTFTMSAQHLWVYEQAEVKKSKTPAYSVKQNNADKLLGDSWVLNAGELNWR